MEDFGNYIQLNVVEKFNRLPLISENAPFLQIPPMEPFKLLIAIFVTFILLPLLFIIYYMERSEKFLTDWKFCWDFGRVVLYKLKLKGRWSRRTFINTFDEAVQKWPNKNNNIP